MRADHSVKPIMISAAENASPARNDRPAIARPVGVLPGRSNHIRVPGGFAAVDRQPDELVDRHRGGGFRIVKPVEILRAFGRTDRRLKPAVSECLEHVLHDGAGFRERDVAIAQNRVTAGRRVLARILRRGIEGALYNLMLHLELFQQPLDMDRAGERGEIQLQHGAPATGAFGQVYAPEWPGTGYNVDANGGTANLFPIYPPDSDWKMDFTSPCLELADEFDQSSEARRYMPATGIVEAEARE